MRLPLNKIKELKGLLLGKPVDKASPATGVNFPIKNRPDMSVNKLGQNIALSQVKKTNYGVQEEDETTKTYSPPKDNELNKALYEKDLRARANNTDVDRNGPEGKIVFKNQTPTENMSVEEAQKMNLKKIDTEQRQRAKDLEDIKKNGSKKRQANPIVN